MSPMNENLLGGPPPTYLPETPEPTAMLASASDPAEVAAKYPTFSAAWAELAQRAIANGQVIAAYAYARTGYHRGLDQLRRSGWKGHGPIPWEHEPNRGFLLCLHVLARAAGDIGETDEAERCATFLQDSSAEAASALKDA